MYTLLDTAVHEPLTYAMIVFVIVGSIVLHELGHALAATWEGDPTPRMLGHLTWNPVTHMGWLSLALVAVLGLGWGQTPVNRRAFRHRRWGSVLVSAAGPAVNVLLAVTGAFVAVLADKGGAPDVLVDFWKMVLEMNVLLFLLNLIPVPPLDGFGVLDGAVDLGELGVQVRRAGALVFIVAIVILNTSAFRHLCAVVQDSIFDAARRVVGAA